MKNCRTCVFIRYFLSSVLLIIIIGLTMTDNLHYLSFITPWNAAILVLLVGVLIFVTKLLEYFKTRN